jgi:hypothetical protein
MFFELLALGLERVILISLLALKILNTAQFQFEIDIAMLLSKILWEWRVMIPADYITVLLVKVLNGTAINLRLTWQICE